MEKKDALPNPFVVFKETFKETYEALAPGIVTTTSRGPKHKQATQIAATPNATPITVVSRKPEQIESSTLVANFGDAMTVLRKMFSTAENTAVGGLQLETMEVNLEVSAEGKIALLGSGGSLSGKTSFTLTFKRA